VTCGFGNNNGSWELGFGIWCEPVTNISSFRDLRVWQQGMDLVEEIYRVSQGFPKYEVYGLAGQMRRAAVSVPANIAEGHIRKHTKVFLNHLSIALGSLAELQTETEVALRLGYLTADESASVLKQSASLARQLHSLRNAIPKGE
jgi:four helix bundle protein